MTAECNGSGEFGDDVDVFQTSDTGIPMLFLWTKLIYRGYNIFIIYFLKFSNYDSFYSLCVQCDHDLLIEENNKLREEINSLREELKRHKWSVDRIKNDDAITRFYTGLPFFPGFFCGCTSESYIELDYKKS